MAWGCVRREQLVQERERPRRPELAVHAARVLAAHPAPRPRRLRAAVLTRVMPRSARRAPAPRPATPARASPAANRSAPARRTCVAVAPEPPTTTGASTPAARSAADRGRHRTGATTRRHGDHDRDEVVDRNRCVGERSRGVFAPSSDDVEAAPSNDVGGDRHRQRVVVALRRTDGDGAPSAPAAGAKRGPSRPTTRCAMAVAWCSSATVSSPASQRSPTRAIAGEITSTRTSSGLGARHESVLDDAATLRPRRWHTDGPRACARSPHETRPGRKRCGQPGPGAPAERVERSRVDRHSPPLRSASSRPVRT